MALWLGPTTSIPGTSSSDSAAWLRTLLLWTICLQHFNQLCHAEVNLSSLSRQDFTAPPLSQSALDKAADVHVRDIKDTDIFKKDDIVLFYRETLPPVGVPRIGDVLLLHGAAYSSHTWSHRVGQPGPTTMQILAAAGYRVVAVDLPGARSSLSQSSGRLTRSTSSWMRDLVGRLDLQRPAIVSPSASGSFSLDYVSTYPQDVGAFIPVAPCCPHSTQHWENVAVPLLIVRGASDGQPHADFLTTKYHNVFIVPKAGHAAYLHQPELWHTTLVNFLNYVFSDRIAAATTKAPRAGSLGISERDVDESQNNFESSNDPQTLLVEQAQQRGGASGAVGHCKTVDILTSTTFALVLSTIFALQRHHNNVINVR